MKTSETSFFSTWATLPLRAAYTVSWLSILLACSPRASCAWAWTNVSNFDALPENEGWTKYGGAAPYSVQNGILHLGSPGGAPSNPSFSRVWNNTYPAGSISGFTYEMRFRVVSGTRNGNQLIYFGFGNPLATVAINAEPGGLRNHWVTEGYSTGSNVIVNHDLTDDFHTMWLAIDSTPTPSFRVWLDSTGPDDGFVGTFTSGFRDTSPGGSAFVFFGDGFQSNSEYFIDFIRYSTEGAFAPVPEPATMSLLALGLALSLCRRFQAGSR